MALPNLYLLLLLFPLLLMNRPVICDNDNEDDTLLKGINGYRASINLTTLTVNKNAECFADKLAEQFKNQPCTNTTGSNTVLGQEPQLPTYPILLAKCHLNISNTRDGIVMPACVPKLDPDLVLTNFTQSQYSENLNDTKFSGAGIGSEGDWIVVVLTTSTPEGSYVTATTSTPEESYATGFVYKSSVVHCLIFMMIGWFILV